MDARINRRTLKAGSARCNLKSCRRSNFKSPLLLALYLAIVVVSLTVVETAAGVLVPPTVAAVSGTMFLACILPMFFVARFSFGYLIGVLFYGVIVGFTWLSYFSSSNYDHATARWSAFVSLLAFLIPALYQNWQARRLFVLTPHTMEMMLKAALCLAGAILLINFQYVFELVGLQDAVRIRGSSSFSRPTILSYTTSITAYAVLPFAFAFFAQRGSKIMAAASLVLILSFYPTLLNKSVLFAAVWLPFIFVVFRFFKAKQASVIYLIAPLLAGLLVYSLGSAEEGRSAPLAFGIINERMFGVPSIAIDYYADFFAAHPHTYFCQINLVRAIAGCPYSEQLGVVLGNQYQVGNLNASLFATEGIASVGLIWAPWATFLCGVLLSVGNSLSRHLPASFIATSAGLGVQALLNVPLSTAFLTHGVAVLFLLWYVCPAEGCSRTC